MAKIRKPSLKYAESLSQLAELFGRNIGTLKSWAQSGAPARTAKGYSIREWIGWRIEQAAKARGDATDVARRNVKLAREQLELRRLEGAMIPLEDAKARLEGWARIVVRNLEAAPVELSTTLTGKTAPEARAILEAWLNEARTKIANSPFESDKNV